MKKIAVIGAGAWGSALAIAFSKNKENIELIAHKSNSAQKIKEGHPKLPIGFNNNIKISANYELITNAEYILIAVPSFAFSETLLRIKPYINNIQKIAWATKGFDTSKKQLLSSSFEDIFPHIYGCAISGPSFAAELAIGKPTTLVVASKDKKTRDEWSNQIKTNSLRAYTNDDILGVEIGGSIKNVLAIATGIAAGLGYGANTQAAIITRGLSEMKRLGISMGANEKTFFGLSGLGDLVLTCSDDLSRNRRFGAELAKGRSIQLAKKNVGATVEGLHSLDMVLELAQKMSVELPICEQVSKVISGTSSPSEAVQALMTRDQISE